MKYTGKNPSETMAIFKDRAGNITAISEDTLGKPEALELGVPQSELRRAINSFDMKG